MLPISPRSTYVKASYICFLIPSYYAKLLTIVVQSPSCVQLCETMTYRTPGLPVLHHLPKLAQVNVNCISGAIQPSHPLLKVKANF